MNCRKWPILVILGEHGGNYHATYGSHGSCLLLPSPYASLLFSFKYLVIIKHRSVTFVQLGSSGLRRSRSQDHQTHCQHGDSKLIDIVNVCGKQHNISSSKKHMALIYCQWSKDLGLITRSSDN